jgi:hypothetical protein
MDITIPDIVTTIFTNEPKDPCSYKLGLSQETLERNVNMFQVLMNILILGAKQLFGESVSPHNMTQKDIQLLQKYFNSFGYNIEYNIETEMSRVVVWFADYSMPVRDCKGMARKI